MFIRESCRATVTQSPQHAVRELPGCFTNSLQPGSLIGGMIIVALLFCMFWGCGSGEQQESPKAEAPAQIVQEESPEGKPAEEEIPTPDETILYKYVTPKLYISKFGSIAQFQRALTEQLGQCGKQDVAGAIKSENRKTSAYFGQKTAEAIVALTSCPDFEIFATAADSPAHGAITVGLWQKLLPETSVPQVVERTRALSLTFEHTDYDRVEWNFKVTDSGVIPQPNDKKSCLTWGPYGATFGHGDEVGNILKRVHEKNQSLLADLFGADFQILWQTVESPASECVGLLMNNVFADATKRAAWKENFAKLGSMPEGITAYEDYAWSNHWLGGNLRRLYSSVFPSETALANATEIDFAFFVDLAMHASISKKRMTKVQDAIAKKESAAGHALAAPERRQIIGQVVAKDLGNTDEIRPRIGRNVAYYVDGVGENKLSPEELDAWAWKGKRRASNFGLSDSRMFLPSFLE